MKTKTMQSIQRSNYSNIYHLLMSNDKLSKKMIADELGLSLPTVTGNLNQLIDQELIMKNGQLESKIGRRAHQKRIRNYCQSASKNHDGSVQSR